MKSKAMSYGSLDHRSNQGPNSIDKKVISLASFEADRPTLWLIEVM